MQFPAWFCLPLFVLTCRYLLSCALKLNDDDDDDDDDDCQLSGARPAFLASNFDAKVLAQTDIVSHVP